MCLISVAEQPTVQDRHEDIRICSSNRSWRHHLLIQRSAGCDHLCLPESRREVDLEMPALQLRALHDEALVQRIPLCAVDTLLRLT